MNIWNIEKLVRDVGQHLYSGRNARIQVLEIALLEAKLWKIPNGILIANILSGRVMLDVIGGEYEMSVGDQIFLEEGESFAFRIHEGWAPGIVQFIWMPGISDVKN